MQLLSGFAVLSTALMGLHHLVTYKQKEDGSDSNFSITKAWECLSSTFQREGEAFVSHRFMFINKKIEGALIDQIGQCYEAFIQIYQAEHPSSSNNWKMQINVEQIDDIVSKALQDLLQSSNGIGAGCFSPLGVPERVIQNLLDTPILLDINQISNPNTCLNHLTAQAPLQTKNIQLLIFTTEKLFQKLREQGVNESCNDEVHDFVIQKIRSMILKSR
jgi:hypothetical protein